MRVGYLKWGDVVRNTGIGIYRTRGKRGRSDTAYVTDGTSAANVPEDKYRQQGLHPEFDRLPWFELSEEDRIFRAPAIQREAIGRHWIFMVVGSAAIFVLIALGAVVHWFA